MSKCFDCGFILPSVTALRTHLKITHTVNNDKNYDFRCAEGGGCFSSFSSWSAFRLHLVSKHKCPLVSSLPVPSQAAKSAPAAPKNDFVPCPMDVDPVESDVDAPAPETCDSKPFIDIKKVTENIILEFAAKLYANPKLPRSFVSEVLKDTSSVLDSMLDVVKLQLREILKACDQEIVRDVEEKLDCLPLSFSKFSSEYFFLKAVKESKFFLSQVKVPIGARTQEVMMDGKMVKKQTEVTANFIPMGLVLQKVFSLPGVYTATKNYVSQLLSESEVLENFVQGDLWRHKIQTHFEGKIVFPLFIYFDEFQVGNVLGSHAGVQKLGAIYYTVPCFPPEVQSLIENVFLAGLFYSSDRAEFGNLAIFKFIINELNRLQSEGICIHTQNGPIIIYFALGLVSGDNLGLNQILGFLESFSAIYPCRLCKTSKFEMQWEVVEARIRTDDMYAYDVAAGDSTATGVKERSIWNRVNFFKVNENYYVDFLHDGPEGAFKKFLALIIHHFSFVCKDTASIDFLSILNDRIKLFDCYHNGLENRPPLISFSDAKDKTIKMSASEMQTFVYIFSMLVGDIVPRDDPVWLFYLSVRRVCDFILAPKLSKDCASILKSNISEMYEMFMCVFPNETVTFKLHNFLHYVLVLIKSGPIGKLSTFKFEAKHKKKKAEANATSSRKDITVTLCHKELLRLAYRLILGVGFAPNNDTGKVTKIILSQLPGFSVWNKHCPASFIGACRKLSWVKINGILYRNGSCIVTLVDHQSDEPLPCFAVIDSVLSNECGDILFLCKPLLNLGFVHDLHAYEVAHNVNEYKLIPAKKLWSPFPVILAQLNGTDYVTLLHTL